MEGPMKGMRILDLTRLIPGGLTTQLLADLGAEVIKVEEPKRGDYLREMAPRPSGQSPAFFLINRGKRSLAVNLKTPEGKEVLHRLIPSTDIVIEQFRPGVAEELGVDYKMARGLKTDLIYCSFSGFGARGPYRDRPAHDLNFMALAGGLHRASGEAPVLPNVLAADIASGFLGAFAILAAVLERHRTGEGRFLDLSIFDAALYLNVLSLAVGETFLSGRFPSYDVYETADGRFLSLAALERRFWGRLTEAVKRPDLAKLDLEQEEEARNAREVLRATFTQKSLREWDDILRRHDVPAAPVQRPEEVPQDPHVRALGLLREVRVRGESMPSLAHPIRWSKDGPERRGHAPLLGEHTKEILIELGYNVATIAEWAEGGIVGMSKALGI